MNILLMIMELGWEPNKRMCHWWIETKVTAVPEMISDTMDRATQVTMTETIINAIMLLVLSL